MLAAGFQAMSRCHIQADIPACAAFLDTVFQVIRDMFHFSDVVHNRPFVFESFGVDQLYLSILLNAIRSGRDLRHRDYVTFPYGTLPEQVRPQQAPSGKQEPVRVFVPKNEFLSSDTCMRAKCELWPSENPTKSTVSVS